MNIFSDSLDLSIRRTSFSRISIELYSPNHVILKKKAGWTQEIMDPFCLSEPECYLFNYKKPQWREIGSAIRGYMFSPTKRYDLKGPELWNFMKDSARYLNSDHKFIKTPTLSPGIRLFHHLSEGDWMEFTPNITLKCYYACEKKKIKTDFVKRAKVEIPDDDEELGKAAISWLKLSVDWVIPMPE